MTSPFETLVSERTLILTRLTAGVLVALYGYARVSTEDQDVSLQVDVLRAAGCARVMEETASGTNRTGRPKLKILMDFIGEGDVLVVTRIDRLARSVKDLQDIVCEMRAKGVTLKATVRRNHTSLQRCGKGWSLPQGIHS